MFSQVHAESGAQVLTPLKHKNYSEKERNPVPQPVSGRASWLGMGCEQSWLRKAEQIAKLENKCWSEAIGLTSIAAH